MSAGISLIIIAVLIWLLSIMPVSDYLLHELEYSNPIPKNPSGDVIVLIGGVSDLRNEQPLPDLSGITLPSIEMLVRLNTAFKIYKTQDIPIIVSSYEIFDEYNPDKISSIEGFLTYIGVPKDKIIIEDANHDTLQNAKNIKAICNDMGFKNPILVTSAFDMKVSVLNFNKAGLDVMPVPINFKSYNQELYNWKDYLPQIRYLDKSTLAIKEYIRLMANNIF